MFLRGVRHELQAVPVDGAAASPVPGAARFELRSHGPRLPRGWVALDLRIEGRLPAAPRLLIDDGSGFTDAAAVKLPLPTAGRIQTVLELPKSVARLALEMGNASRVNLGALSASELGRAETAARLVLPIVRDRLREPWSIPISAVRFARALTRRGALHRFSQKQKLDEPQLWYEEWHQRFARLSDADRDAIRRDVLRMGDGPRFSVLVLPGDQAQVTMESLRAQLYPRWDLSGADCDFVVVLRAGDELAEEALYLFARAAKEHPDAGVLYADEDRKDAQGRLYDPQFKPEWNPDLFLSMNYLGRAWAMRSSLYGNGSESELLLRAVAGGAKVYHVPFPVLHRRAGDAQQGSVAAVQQHVGATAQVEPGPLPGTQRVRWRLPAEPPLVSLIIPTRNGREVLEPCIESLLAHTEYRRYEILIVDNGSDDPLALEYLQALETRGVARVLRYPHPFNFSAINNFAVREARGEVVGLLNNDLEFIEPGWLGEMLSHALRPGVGCVGARLLYPDRTVQHAGVVLGIGGVADHVHKFLPAEAPGYCGRAQLTQDFSAVTAACLLIRRETYLDVGGFDEGFAVAFNDVDFCLRVRERGLRNVWTPFATVIHHESKSRGREDTLAKMLRFRGEIRRLKARWGRALLEDPAYSPSLTLDAKNFSLAWPPRARPPWKR